MAIDGRKVAAYIRWSTEDQGEGTTLDVQRESCQKFIESQGWVFREDLVFVDDGYSGGSIKRPALTALRKAVKDKLVQCVVVFKIDRLSRSVIDTVNLVLEEWEGFCYLKSSREPIDTTTPMGKQFFYMLVSYAEWERSVIRERTMSGKVKRAQQGKNPGIRLPFGYKSGLSSGSIEIDEERAPIVRQVFESYAKGIGINRIAQELNSMGVRSWAGKAWQANSVYKMLTNDSYIGRLGYGETKKNERRGKVEGETIRVRTESPLSMHLEAFPPLIDESMWDACLRIRTQRKRVSAGRDVSSGHLLTGIVTCKCGTNLQAHLGSGGRRWYYRCPSTSQRGNCDCGLIPMEMLDAYVVKKVLAYRDTSMQEYVLRQVASAQQTRKQDLESLIAGHNATLKRLDNEEKKVRRDYRTGELSAFKYEAVCKDIDEERQEVIAARKQVEQTLAFAVDSAKEQTYISERLQRMSAWDLLTVTERKQLLRDLIQSANAHRAAKSKDTIDLSLRIRYVD